MSIRFNFNRMIIILGLLLIFSACAAKTTPTEEGVISQDNLLVTLEAKVKAIDKAKRMVTLQDASGDTLVVLLDEDAGGLNTIDAGDLVSINYLETVTIEVMAPDSETGLSSGAVVAATGQQMKPAALVASHTELIVKITQIDMENELVTVQGKEGNTVTVKPRYPENLKKVQTGDIVKVTYTEAVGFSITEK